MTYPEAVDFLSSLVDFERLGFHRHFAETVGLDSARRLMSLLGDPHLAVPAVHIAGTKGKGSTAAMVERILREAGYRVGLFTSPHLVSFHERVRVSGEPIGQADVAGLVSRIRPALEQVRQEADLTPCTFFETYFALAAMHFLAAGVDIAVYETGLGGRLDATNLLAPAVAAVTTIGYDHTYILGDTLDAIAREKAHIAKPCTPLVVAGNQPPEARQAIAEVAAATLAEVAPTPEVRRKAPALKAAVGPGGTWTPPRDRLHVQTGPLAGEYDAALVGEHQAVNAAVAIGILEHLLATGYTIEPMHVAEGLRKVRWPGRLDVRACRPWLVFDCAHNGESAAALARAVPDYLDYDRLILVVGMSGDKDISAFAAALAPLGARVILTRAAIDRALPVEQVASRAGGLWDTAEQIADVGQACQRAVELAGEEGAVCITGSFYVVGEAMQSLGIEP